MKLGILTFHSSYNFGANLQALATQEALRARGVDVVIVNYRDPRKMATYHRVVSSRQAEKHEAFCRQYLNESPLLATSDKVEQYCRDHLDGVLVGSDAVFSQVARNDPRRWVRRITGRRAELTFDGSRELPAYFLDWKRTGQRAPLKASLAASATGTPFGFLSWGDYPKLFRALNQFDHLSVRDSWTRAMVATLTLGRKTAVHCPDPVFALNRHFEIPLKSAVEPQLRRTVLVSGHFERSWLDRFASCCHDAGYLVASLPNPEDDFRWDGLDWEVRLPLGPIEWYRLLSAAAGFVGIRFHAMVSCLSNGTPVVSVDTGPPALRPGYRFASKYRDVMRRAGLLARYHDKRSIRHARPESVLVALRDEKLNQAARQYASIASKQFEHNLTLIVKRCEAICEAKEGHRLLCL